MVLWGEVVLFKDVAALKHKGEPTYRKGIWVGKSTRCVHATMQGVTAFNGVPITLPITHTT